MDRNPPNFYKYHNVDRKVFKKTNDTALKKDINTTVGEQRIVLVNESKDIVVLGGDLKALEGHIVAFSRQSVANQSRDQREIGICVLSHHSLHSLTSLTNRSWEEPDCGLQ